MRRDNMEKMLADLLKRIELLEADNKALKERVIKLEADNTELWDRVEELEEIECEEEE